MAENPPVPDKAVSVAAKLFIILVLAGASALIYWRFILPKLQKRDDAPEPAVTRLVRTTDAQIGSLFAPLNWNSIPADPQSFRKLRERIADEAITAKPTEREKYRLAMLLCDTMLAASTERLAAEDALRKEAAKPAVTALGTPEQIEAKRRFFSGHIDRKWDAAAPSYKARTIELYTLLRAEVRRLGGKDLAPPPR